jgi:GalNAc-alpha-(1->4)-GalNAc-alpha-(1->3)-diNAcBac-PP-undecaprenol alpha-1,4-N-acetyl-D-galactosaminyltransferase
VVLSFGELWNNFVLLALYGTKIPIVVSDRSSPAKRLSFVHDQLRKILYSSATKIIVQTIKAKEIYAQFLPEHKLVGLPNPIRHIAHTHDSPHEREKIILNVSRLIHTKHHDRLIRLFARLNAPEWKLVIVGGDAQKQNNLHQLLNLARQLTIESRASFLGYEKNVDQ